MALHDFVCSECEYVGERNIKEGDNPEPPCPNCGSGNLKRVWLKAPAMRMGGDGSNRSIASMKKSFNERFIKKEIDDVRHRHGDVFNDSLRGGAVERIKKGG